MNVKIQFSNNFVETSIPIIRLTKSRNGKTGTATFLFIRPTFFEQKDFSTFFLEEVFLIWEKKKIASYDIQIFFNRGKPFLIKVLFLFKNAKEWFLFLNFMNSYAKETGLSFDEFIENKSNF